MNDNRKSIGSLLLLFAQDSNDVTQELIRQLKGVPFHTVCVDDPILSTHHALQTPANCRLHIVFFSPGLLDFLEFRTEEAYVAFRFLDPVSTLAVFCCGLQERQVMCYHMALLNSFNSWSMFQIPFTEKNGHEFPQYLLQSLKEMFPETNSNEEDILIIPELINLECNTVFIIFSKAVQDVGEFSVSVESEYKFLITPYNVNPYVVKFEVPEAVIESCQTIAVKIQKSNRPLREKVIRVVQNVAHSKAIPLNSPKGAETTIEELTLDEQRKFLSEFASRSAKTIENETLSVSNDLYQSDEDKTHSLNLLCKKYGLEELSPFINEAVTPTNAGDENTIHFFENANLVSPEARRQNRRNCDECMDLRAEDNTLRLPNEDMDFHPTLRSMSLPSLLPEEFNARYGEYLTMAGIRTAAADSEEEDLPCLQSNDGYVTMKWRHGRKDSPEIVTPGLYKNQQNLTGIMLEYKNGNRMVFDVDAQIQTYNQRRHRILPHDCQLKKEKKVSILPDWKRLGQNRSRWKNSKASGIGKRFSESEDTSNQECPRKISDASASSSNSKIDENNSSEVHSSGSHMEKVSEVSTGWIPSTLTSPACPSHSKKQPPPVPSKPSYSSSTPKLKDSMSKCEGAIGPISISNLQLNQVDDDEERFNTCELPCESEIKELEQYISDEFCPNPTKHQDHLGSPVYENQLIIDDILDRKEFLNNRTQEWANSILIQNEPDRIKSTNCAHEDCLLNSLTSHIYMSIKSQGAVLPNPTQLKNSVFEQELFEIMQAFKRGDKTISQVEQQFQEWHIRHTKTSSYREKELLRLKREYEKAQKSNSSGFIKFILGKPKKKNSKVSESEKNTVKHRNKNRKSESDTKRLSKISCTSTSSGVSDNSDVFRTIYNNPEYGWCEKDGDCKKIRKSPKLSTSSAEGKPPPLPPRPPLLSLASQQHEHVRKSPIVPQNETSIMIKTVPNIPKKKPSPPPKPPNLLVEVNCDISLDKPDGDQENQVQDQQGVAESQQKSPDYISPNEVRFFQSLKRPWHLITKDNHHCPPKYPVPVSAKGSLSKIAKQVVKCKKKDESMFYVTCRKWSSFPDLKTSQLTVEPIYLELLGPVDVEEGPSVTTLSISSE